MFFAITENTTGETYVRHLAPKESIDPEFHARKWAEQNDIPVHEANGYIPSGCADFYAETRDTKEPTGSCWKSFDFFVGDFAF